MKYPYARPNVTNADILAVKKSLTGQFLTGGSIITSFEKQLSKQFDVKNTIVCNSGTAALHLIYMSLGLQKGELILTSPITFVATANAALMCGAKVILADVDPMTGMLTPESIEVTLKKSRKKVKIITLVHIGGRVSDLEGIAKVAKKHNIFLVEDACHAPGAKYFNHNNKISNIGSCKYSVASSFSFHAIKNITMAEGGCVTTNNKILADKIRLKLNHGIIRIPDNINDKKFLNPWYYKVEELGYNYRASEINCALGLSQLKRLKSSLKERKKIANLYKKELKSVPYISFPKFAFELKSNAWHLFTIFINFKDINLSKKDLVHKLQVLGIGTQVHYIPLFLQPVYKIKERSNFKGAIEYYEKSLSLPMYIGLKKKDIIYISKALKSIIMKHLKN